MFKLFLSTMILFSSVSQAKNTKTLSCQEDGGLFYTFGLAAEFSGPNLVGEMVVSDRTQSWTHNFKFAVAPEKSTDMESDVEKLFNHNHFQYKLENRNGCSFFFLTPVDVIEYQNFDAKLKNTFVAKYEILCPTKNKHIEKVMTCQFVDANGISK